MPHRHHYIYVLWARRFEEMSAIIFVTTLRKAGLPVKVIGLDGPSAVGVCGITLLTDWTLDQALPAANRAICLILPCEPAYTRRLTCDPRLSKLIQQLRHNRALCLIGPQQTGSSLALNPDSPAADPLLLLDEFTVYPTGAELVGFAAEIAMTFAHKLLIKD